MTESELVAQHEANAEHRRWEARREKFALAIFRTLVEQNVRTYMGEIKSGHWTGMAREAVIAADSLEQALNPDQGPILPDYEG